MTSDVIKHFADLQTLEILSPKFKTTLSWMATDFYRLNLGMYWREALTNVDKPEYEFVLLIFQNIGYMCTGDYKTAICVIFLIGYFFVTFR